MKTIDGKYEVIRQLGAGGMGGVYEARHRTTHRRVAVKVILEEAKFEPGVVERFEREARVAGGVDSEHLTQVLDAGVDAETKAPYLVMELLDGEDADSLLKRLGPLRPELALRIVGQMLEGLERAHRAGIVHRDVKPANVFLAKRPDDDSRVVKVCDFGIAKVKADPLSGSEHALTRSSSLLGSPAYMSPEQAKGARDVDARADVWSAGVVLYQLLVGSTPHVEADTLGLLLLAICSEPAKPIRLKAPWVPAPIEAVVSRALEIEREQRFSSAAEMLEAIRVLLPDGLEIDGEMLTPISDRSVPVTIAFDATNLSESSPTPRAISKPPTAETPKVTTLESAGVERPRRRWWIGAGAVAVAVTGVGLAARAALAPTPVAPTQGLMPDPSAGTPVVPIPVAVVPSASVTASASATPSASSAVRLPTPSQSAKPIVPTPSVTPSSKPIPRPDDSIRRTWPG